MARVVPGQAGNDAGASVSPIWRDRGRGSGSILDRWSGDVANGSVTSSGADVVWDQALGLLGGSMAELGPRLIGTVGVVGGPQVSLAEFLGGLDRQVAPAGSFPTTLLTDMAIADSVARVTADIRQVAHMGLGVVCTSAQLSDALVIDQLVDAADRGRTDLGWDRAVGPAPDSNAYPDSRPLETVNEFRAPDLGRGFEF